MKNKLKKLEEHYGRGEIAEVLGISKRQYHRIRTSGKSTDQCRELVDAKLLIIELSDKIKRIAGDV